MLPSVKPLATAVPLFCLPKPRTAPLPGVGLLLYIWKLLVNVVLAFIVRVWLLLVPRTELPLAVKRPVTVTAL